MRSVLVVTAALVLVLTSGIGALAFRLGERASAAALPDTFGPMSELYERLAREAVDLPDDEALAEGALAGMLEGLGDPYAAFYSEDDFADLNRTLDGEFSGVGLVLGPAEEGLMVMDVIEGTPAAAAGIEVGEIVVSVNGNDVTEDPIETVVTKVKGPAGTPVVIGFEGGSAGPREVRLIRAEIDIPTVSSRLLDDGAGLIELSGFSRGSAEEVRDAIGELEQQGATGFVLDLRGNPGGLLDEAVDVVSAFAEDGIAVSVRERDEDSRVLRVSGETVTDAPLVVLVNQGSASASEIVAGAIQDLHRGQVVGTVTFGKGTVQTVEALDDYGVKFTTAEYLTPSGDSIDGIGVQPDVHAGEDPTAQLAAAQQALLTLTAER